MPWQALLDGKTAVCSDGPTMGTITGQGGAGVIRTREEAVLGVVTRENTVNTENSLSLFC